MKTSRLIRPSMDHPVREKSTVARGAAKRLGFLYVDTGALYRAIGLYVKRANTDPDSADAVASLLPEIHVSLSHGADGEQHVFLCGEDVSAEIRENEISAYASAVSALPPCGNFCSACREASPKATLSLWTAATSAPWCCRMQM